MTVDLATTDTSTTVDPAIVATTEAGTDQSAPLSEDAAMEAVWDKLVVSNGAERENGKFVSPDPEKRAAAEAAKQAPLEGGEEGDAAASTVADVPLPANWAGKDGLWAKLPADVKAEIAEHQTAQHAKFSDMGRKVATYEPLQQAASEFAEYFNGNLKGSDGKPIAPADGIRYLAGIQRAMDRDPVNTILSIMDTYQARDKVAALLGVKAADGAQPDQVGAQLSAALAKIDRLESHLSALSDPSRIEKVVDEKTDRLRHEQEVSRLTASKPLYAEIPEEDMVFYINKAWKTLGQDAQIGAVFDHAYTAAIEANPALRAKSQAASKAANDDAAKAEAAKRGNSVNVKSTASTKPAKQSEDDAMEEVWRKHHQ